MKAGKFPIAGMVLVLTIILLTIAFISRGPDGKEGAGAKAPKGPERGVVNPPQMTISPDALQSLRETSVVTTRDDEIVRLQRIIAELQAQAEEMTADNERMKAALHNLSLQIDWKKAKKPVPADWLQHLDTMSEKVTQQRTAVKELREKTLQAARAAGAPDSVVDVDITKVLILPPGPDYSDFSKLRTDLHKETRALERMELELSEVRMQVPIDFPVESK